MNTNDVIHKKVKNTLIKAASMYRLDQVQAFKNAICNEKSPRAKWILENIFQNSVQAENNQGPLCDDTGIPHLFIELGRNKQLSGDTLEAIHEGIAEGLRELPGRPMSIKGNYIERLEQIGGLDEDPGAVVSAPLMMKYVDEDVIRLYILLQGGGPEIRGRTYRVFHQHSMEVIVEELVKWASEEVGKLGCTPCSAAIGIGRSHFEATSLMIEAMAKGNFSKQNKWEKEITKKINQTNVGPLGLGGDTTALATFLNIGPQRASGVRIACLRLCCCVEPRVASVLL
ncbi:fumarate hydratase [uncultured Clostridium sp.]|uniref:fumarate hydratase n=1 Tax=uncultured Clostridium sp. TaxID=59620 RepID=UPI0028F0BE93|nr:fumarate hydratase [uncultured Clostridium sp.]